MYMYNTILLDEIRVLVILKVNQFQYIHVFRRLKLTLVFNMIEQENYWHIRSGLLTKEPV